MDLAVALGATTDADVVIANDPDADRCCVAVGSRVLTGDELGWLLADHVLRNTNGSDRLVVTTIVSSTMLRRMAAAHGVQYAETLTGFKWIVRANPPGTRFVFGYEEALGYCIGAVNGPGVVRDKDGIGAALAVAELAADLKARGRTLLDRLDELAQQHGLHATSQWSVRVDELAQIADRHGDAAGGAADDAGRAPRGPYRRPARRRDGTAADGRPDVLAGHADSPYGRVVVRPSGTEPKLKAYLEVVVPVRSTVDAARAQAAPALAAIKAALQEITGLT